jgi:hypothetical protein
VDSNKHVQHTGGDAVDGGVASLEGTGVSGTAKSRSTVTPKGVATDGSGVRSVGGGKATSSGQPTRQEKRAAKFVVMRTVPRGERRAKEKKEKKTK